MALTEFFVERDYDVMMEDLGNAFLLEPTVKTLDNLSGQETLTAGTLRVITGNYFFRTNQKWTYDESAQIEGGDAAVLIKIKEAAKKDDIVISYATNVVLTAIDGDATTISVTTTSAHNLSVGDKIAIFNTTNYNGRFTIATVPTSTTFTIADTAHDFAAETVGQVASVLERFRIREILHVPGQFNETENPVFTYDYCNLFTAENED